jgi:ankyrin repeat protein
MAANWGCPKSMKRLLMAQADPNMGANDGRTPFHFAIQNPEMVKLLLDHGASVSAQNANGETAFHLAARSGNEEIVKLLLNRASSLEVLAPGSEGNDDGNESRQQVGDVEEAERESKRPRSLE